MISFSSFCLSASTRRGAMQRDTMEQNRLLKDRKQTHFLFFFSFLKKWISCGPDRKSLICAPEFLCCHVSHGIVFHVFSQNIHGFTLLHRSKPPPICYYQVFVLFYLSLFFLSKRKMIIWQVNTIIVCQYFQKEKWFLDDR